MEISKNPEAGERKMRLRIAVVETRMNLDPFQMQNVCSLLHVHVGFRIFVA